MTWIGKTHEILTAEESRRRCDLMHKTSRVLCMMDGLDPDEDVMNNGLPMPRYITYGDRASTMLSLRGWRDEET